ncbi:hypothetical protein ACUNV4_28535 [Granulosicoccus sp. 3-233]|uniref:hypothetical protein n=1 Tax=Granulosicoccus sp. 3-233 TaxID=3417969 RepID=UPI003D347929
MSSGQLSKLESLSQTRVDQARSAVEQQRLELSIMDRQHQELKAINREYQEGVIGESGIAPQLLAQRRAFVAQLTEKLDMLSLQRQQREQLLQSKLAEQKQHTAQTAAIGSLVEKRLLHEAHIAARQEQSQLEQAVQGIQHVNKLNSEDEHV